MATYDTPLALLPVAPAARRASPTPLASAATRRRTLGAIAAVRPRDRLADRPAILLAFVSLPFLALASAIRRRRARSGSRPDRAE